MTDERGRARAAPDGGLRAMMHAALRRVHWQALELGTMGSGCPDTNGCWRGTEFWIECKRVSSETGLVGLQPNQVGWILRRMRAGGRVFVLTWLEHDGGVRKGEPVSRLYLHEGWDALVLRTEGLGAAPPVWTGDAPWDWEDLLRVLTEWTISPRA